MSRLTAPSVISTIAAICIAWVFTPGTTNAQAEGPTYVAARILNVRPDSIAAFEAAVAERARTEEAAGRPYFHVYERIRGDLPGYTIFAPDGLYNELPPVQADAAWQQRIRDTEDRTSLVTLAVYPELSIFGGSVEPSGEYMRVRVRTVSPANREAYHSWAQNDLVPLLRRSGVTDLRSGRIVFGGNTDTFVMFTYQDTATQSTLNVEAVGEREAQRVFSRERELLATAEDLLYRFRPDLSFTAD